MKRKVIIFCLFVAGCFVAQAQERCDTLKLKVIKTYYCQSSNGVNFKFLGDLNGAVINIDTLSAFYPAVNIVNVSNDTFFSNDLFAFWIRCIPYADTGAIAFFGGTMSYSFGIPVFPNDTIGIHVGLKFDLSGIINDIKENDGIELEEISYWKMLIGIGRTSKDGIYSDSVIYASADTSTFYVVKNSVGIVETQCIASLPQIFPNPTRSQFTVTHTEKANLYLYNIVGQEVLQTYSKEDNTIVNINFLPQGVYVLKVVKEGNVSVHKVIVSE